MRTLIVDLGRDYRGGQHQALLLLEGLLRRGHAPELIAARNSKLDSKLDSEFNSKLDSQLAARAKEIGVPVHGVEPDRRRLAAAWRIRTLLRERRIDLIHANEPHALTSAWLAQAHHAVPIVVSRRIALPLSKSRFSLARYRAAARVIAVSHFVAQSVIQSGIPGDRISVIYDGVTIPPQISQAQRESARKQLGIAPDQFCIGNVAAFVPEKGHALLLDALAVLRARFPQCVLLFRGDGPELSKLQSLASRHSVAGAVQFLPPTVEIETMFAAMNLFAFPSHAEPLGSALLAAMAHGLPVVAMARGGVPEVVEEGKNGVLVKNLDPDELASAIAHLIAQPDEAARLGLAARETIQARFSADRMTEETLRLYERLVTGRE